MPNQVCRQDSALPPEIVALHAAGFDLISIPAGAKAPRDARWNSAPRKSLAELETFAASAPDSNWGLRLYPVPGLGWPVCFDLDIDDAAKAPEAHASLSEIFPGWEDFPTVATGSGGARRHVYAVSPQYLSHCIGDFLAGEGWRIELRATDYGSGLQCAIPPSKTAGPYRWIKPIDLELWELIGRGAGMLLPEAVAARLVEVAKQRGTYRPANAVPCDNIAPIKILANPTDEQREWARAELGREVEKVSVAKEGWRNEIANAAILRCASLAAHCLLTRSECEAEFLPAIAALGISTREARQWFRHAWRDGLKKPARQFLHHVDANGLLDEEPAGVEIPATGEGLGQAVGRDPGGDYALACVFAERVAGRLLYNRSAGAWIRYDSGVGAWKSCERGEHEAEMVACARERFEAACSAYRDRPTAANTRPC